MIRRFNFTGRKRIDANRVRIQLLVDPLGRNCFQAHINLNGLGLPSSARLVIEAYRQSAYMRFDFGTVANFEHSTDTVLSSFYDPRSALFRLKVIASGTTPGLLLAEADAIHPTLADDPKGRSTSLLHVTSDDLEGETWRLDFDPQPLLKVERRLGNAQTWVRSPSFVALVLPAVLREVLHRAIKDGVEGDDAEGWQADWVRFAEQLPGVPAAPDGADNDELERWIERVAQSFGRHHSIVNRLAKAGDPELT